MMKKIGNIGDTSDLNLIKELELIVAKLNDVIDNQCDIIDTLSKNNLLVDKGSEIKKLRLAQGMTTKQVARLVGLEVNDVFRIESNSYRAPDEFIDLILDVLKATDEQRNFIKSL